MSKRIYSFRISVWLRKIPKDEATTEKNVRIGEKREFCSYRNAKATDKIWILIPITTKTAAVAATIVTATTKNAHKYV